MKSIDTTISESLNEKADTDWNTLTVKFRDDSADGSDFAKFINYIAANGNTGHSFSIVIDPDDSEKKKRFGWDGDGVNRIDSVELNGKKFDKSL